MAEPQLQSAENGGPRAADPYSVTVSSSPDRRLPISNIMITIARPLSLREPISSAIEAFSPSRPRSTGGGTWSACPPFLPVVNDAGTVVGVIRLTSPLEWIASASDGVALGGSALDGAASAGLSLNEAAPDGIARDGISPPANPQEPRRPNELERLVKKDGYVVVPLDYQLKLHPSPSDGYTVLRPDLLADYLVVESDGRPIGVVSVPELPWALLSEMISLRERVWELEAAVSLLHDGIGVSDGRGNVLWINEGYTRTTGITKEEAGIGENLSTLVERGMLSRSVAIDVIRSRQPQTVKQTFKTGKEVLASGTPLFDENGELVRVIVNFRDLTELSRLQRAWEKSRELNLRYELELERLRSERTALEGVVAESKKMRSAICLATRVAPVDSTVLITGESGAGKEVIAKIIHRAGPRAKGPFVQVNCGAIPEQLLESELFGYDKGAFTGANKEGKPGLFEIADRGTLFLDEIGELSPNLQVKLLKALEQQEIMRIGGRRPVKLDVRIIAATNCDLARKVKERSFREDLYYRLNVIHIYVPPLRERREDITPLALFFARKIAEKYSVDKRLSAELLRAFESYDWPGNVRELENTVERLMIVSDGETILPEDFLGEEADSRQRTRLEPIVVNQLIPLKEAQEILERELLVRALRNSKTVRRAAKSLGLAHSNVLRRMSKYGITHDSLLGNR